MNITTAANAASIFTPLPEPKSAEEAKTPTPFSDIEDTVEISSAALRSDNEDTVFPPLDEPIDV